MLKNLVNAHTPKLPLTKTATDGDKDPPYNINNYYYFTLTKNFEVETDDLLYTQ